MDRILRGIMKYRDFGKQAMVKQFEQVRDDPHPKAVFFTCMDSRMIPTRFTQTNVGDMFVGKIVNICFVYQYPELDDRIEKLIIVRNAGNTNEPINSIDESKNFSEEFLLLRAWLCTHALSSLEKFQQLQLTDFSKPILFQAETPLRKFVAYIDPENKFAVEDKLSQINTLQQLQNIASYGFLKKRLETNELHIHALWFDIYTGEIYYFSRAAKTFVAVNEETFGKILDEVQRYYS
ncbi:carbonic anhydrase [Holotrichia oblita]|uniref:Carbonic anhydrase n=1 Tax=Holotrichia oblita TaxID=644536 RepID=A0ACB9TH18_HOLOL|nr:carbonic anhydrase [Holotrichia oblita]